MIHGFNLKVPGGTVRDDGTATMVTAGHTLDALKYGVRRAGNTVNPKVLTFGYAGPQLIPSNVGPCGYSRFNDSNPWDFKT